LGVRDCFPGSSNCAHAAFEPAPAKTAINMNDERSFHIADTFPPSNELEVYALIL
jgi:hypothetical protein